MVDKNKQKDYHYLSPDEIDGLFDIFEETGQEHVVKLWKKRIPVPGSFFIKMYRTPLNKTVRDSYEN